MRLFKLKNKETENISGGVNNEVFYKNIIRYIDAKGKDHFIDGSKQIYREKDKAIIELSALRNSLQNSGNKILYAAAISTSAI